MTLLAVYLTLVVLALLGGRWAGMGWAKIGVVVLVMPVAAIFGFGLVGMAVVTLMAMVGGILNLVGMTDGVVSWGLALLGVVGWILAVGIPLFLCARYFIDERALGVRAGLSRGTHLPLGVERHRTRLPLRYHGGSQV